MNIFQILVLDGEIILMKTLKGCFKRNQFMSDDIVVVIQYILHMFIVFILIKLRSQVFIRLRTRDSGEIHTFNNVFQTAVVLIGCRHQIQFDERFGTLFIVVFQHLIDGTFQTDLPFDIRQRAHIR